MINLFSKITGLYYRYLAKPLLFRIEPESVHNHFVHLGHKLGRIPTVRHLVARAWRYDDPILEQTVHGIRFLNPVGLSAGFDKDGYLPGILSAVGFGFAEIGTVTLRPYAGNPPPRLWRLPATKSIVVNYGLKNDGVAAIANRLKNSYLPPTLPLNISIGKTNCRETANREKGIQDYAQCFREAIQANIGQFFTINISCPNTFGGEPFTNAADLEQLLSTLDKIPTAKPVFLKMPVNHTWPQFQQLLDIALKHRVHGVIIGNLNKDRQHTQISDDLPANMPGGLSGRPTWQLSNDLISQTYRYCGNRLTIIGVGGIFSAADAYEKIRRGATLVQLITGMIFEGPQLIGQINRGLAYRLRRDGYKSITDAIGSTERQLPSLARES